MQPDRTSSQTANYSDQYDFITKVYCYFNMQPDRTSSQTANNSDQYAGLADLNRADLNQ